MWRSSPSLLLVPTSAESSNFESRMYRKKSSVLNTHISFSCYSLSDIALQLLHGIHTGITTHACRAIQTAHCAHTLYANIVLFFLRGMSICGLWCSRIRGPTSEIPRNYCIADIFYKNNPKTLDLPVMML